ncbi:MAG: ABC transporter substrate-binding protein [Eubacteriales bacterium]
MSINFRKVLSLVLAVFMLVSCVAILGSCGLFTPAEEETTGEGTKPGEEEKNSIFTDGDYTYNTYTALSPSNWNELTYQDNNDTQIMSYIGSSFFTYDFKYDENGKIIPGDFVVKYDAATKLEDVSALVDAKWGIPEGSKGYAWKITLRSDLKWDDGTPIKAEDFVYTMKEQLAPEFQNYRADSFYAGATIIHNAENYVKQGQTLITDNGVTGLYAIADLVKGTDGVYTQPDGAAVYIAVDYPLDWTGGNTLADYVGAYGSAYFGMERWEELAALANDEGLVAVTEDTLAMLSSVTTSNPAWGETDDDLPNYLVYNFTYPETKFEDVGIFVGDNEYELVLVLDKSLPLLKDDGSLSYQAAYNMSSLPLVHREKFEANKVAPSEGTTLWTSTYNSSVATTASWGPYKLESFQSGKQYTLVRNENWYGYYLKENFGQYQTDKIVCDTVGEWNSAWTMFLAGKIDSIGIDVTIADDYKGSEQAYFTPDDFVASLQLQSDVEQLKARETEGVNKSILGYSDFRKALSLSINRADFAAKTTTSSLAGFGLFNSMHYYDVENGKAYRQSDDAKKVLCNIYSVDYTKYPTLDDAVDAITGYDLTTARALVTKAYNEALANGDIKEGDKVVLTMGSGTINETVQRRFDYITNAWKELVVGTPLEGRLETEVKDFATAWANDFRAGGYDVCMGGWTGAAWDPGYFLLAYLSPDYMYSAAWDTSSVEMTFTMKGVGKDGADVTETMSLMEWYDCLNGAAGAKYDWSATALENEQRLQLIAALEEQVLGVYYTVPLYNNFAASLISYKVDYITYEYNTFMGYGGIRYMTYNYNDAEWAEAVAAAGGELNYKN